MARCSVLVATLVACGFDSGGVGGGTSEGTSASADTGATEPDPSATVGMTGSATTNPASTSTTGDDTSSSGSHDSGPDVTGPSDTSASEAESSGGGVVGPLCGGLFWQSEFDIDPTTLDINGDGIDDWEFEDGDFPAAALVDGAWQVEAEQAIRTAPDDPFATRVFASVRMRAVETGNRGAAFWVNLGQDDASLTRLWANVGLMADGTQTATVGGFVGDMMSVQLVSVPALGTGFIAFEFDADVATSMVSVTIEGLDYGTIALPSYDGSAQPVAGVGVRSNRGEIDAVSVERCP